MFEIRFDPAERLLHLRLWGFWDVTMLDAFVTELARTIALAERTMPAFDTLSDVRAFPIQSAAVIDGFGELMNALADARHGRVALIASGILSKLQALRAIGTDEADVFLDEAAARAWLAKPRRA